MAHHDECPRCKKNRFVEVSKERVEWRQRAVIAHILACDNPECGYSKLRLTDANTGKEVSRGSRSSR